MRKIDTWQDGSALDTIGEMDSAGSCDSVVSFNSCFSDDSLEFLSAEEKACLMFLEETIQSLDTEDDSGLSNDEPDQIPARGNVATKAAHLSASMGANKRPGRNIPRRHFEDPSPSGSPEKNENVNYMVPTPFILANGNSQFPNRLGLATSPTTKKLSAMKIAPEKTQPCQEAMLIHSGVNVVVIPPPHKTKSKKENLNNRKAQKGSSSYEGSASIRKSNAAEADSEKHPCIPAIQTVLQKSKSKESVGTKPVPPPVAPKPKLKASMSQEGATESNVPHVGLLRADKLMNPEKVRLEALCKLGLLKVEPSHAKQVRTIPQSPAHNQTTGEPYRPCVAPKPGKLNLQHQRSVSDVCADPPRPRPSNMTAMVKAATLKRIGPSGSDITELNTVSLSSSTVETKKHRDTQIDASQSRLRKDQESEKVSKSQHVQGFNVPVHSIGKDRRDALRKLGLLKN